MALSFVMWEKIVGSFPDDRIGQEFQDPGSTVAGPEKPPQAIIIAEMGQRNAAREADKAMRASQGQPNGTIAEQIYNEFAGPDEESRPPGGPGGGPPPGGPGGPPPGPGGPGGPPPGAPPMGPGGPPMGGPPPGGPPMGGPPMMAHGGLVPGYQEGGFFSGLGRLTTGAGSWEEAAENPFKTTARTALSLAMLNPSARLLRGGIGGLMKLGRPGVRGLQGIAGRYATGLEAKGGMRGRLGRALGARPPVSKFEGPKRWARKPPEIGPRLDPQLDLLKPNPEYPWANQLSSAQNAARRAYAAKRLDASAGAVGRRALLRGGGAMGITGLIAMDPFDARFITGDPETRAGMPDNRFMNSSAERKDRAKASRGFGDGAFDWMLDEMQEDADLEELAGMDLARYSDVDESDESTAADLADRLSGGANQTWADRQAWRDRINLFDSDVNVPGYVAPRQGYAQLPSEGYGGIGGLGYHEGGDIPAHPSEHGSGPGQHLVGETPMEDELIWDPDSNLGTPPGTYGSGGRSILGDIGRWGARRWQDARGASAAANVGIRNAYEALLTGQQYGPQFRDDEGRLLPVIGGRYDDPDAETYDPRETGWSGRKVLSPRIPDPNISGRAGRPEGENVGSPANGNLADLRLRDLGDPRIESADELWGVSTQRQDELLDEEEEWGRGITGAEEEQDKYWASRAQDARNDSINRLYADVSNAIASSGGERGGIARGLKDAIYGQIEQAEIARNFEGLPITAAAQRSRYNTYAQRVQALQEIMRAASSRGEVDATLQQRINEIRDTLSQGREMTPDDLLNVSNLLNLLVNSKGLEKEDADRIFNEIALREVQSMRARG